MYPQRGTPVWQEQYKYSTASASTGCEDCAAGKYTPNTGGTSAATCIPCGTGSIINQGICCCNNGYTGPDQGTCSACALGKYKYWVGPDTRVSCDYCMSTVTTASQSLTLILAVVALAMQFSMTGLIIDDCVCHVMEVPSLRFIPSRASTAI